MAIPTGLRAISHSELRSGDLVLHWDENRSGFNYYFIYDATSHQQVMRLKMLITRAGNTEVKETTCRMLGLMTSKGILFREWHKLGDEVQIT